MTGPGSIQASIRVYSPGKYSGKYRSILIWEVFKYTFISRRSPILTWEVFKYTFISRRSP